MKTWNCFLLVLCIVTGIARGQVPDSNPFRVVKEQPWRVIPLPGRFEEVVAAGSGRYLLMHFPPTSELAFFDLAEQKITKKIPLASNDVLFAGGAKAVLICYRDRRVVQRWSIDTLKPEVVESIEPAGEIMALAMGHADDHWAVLVTRRVLPNAVKGPPLDLGIVSMIDAKSLKPIPNSFWRDDHPRNVDLGREMFVRASADGSVFNAQGLLLQWKRGRMGPMQPTRQGIHFNRALPNHDGRLFCTGRGVSTEGMNSLWHNKQLGHVVPSLQPGYFFALSEDIRLTDPSKPQVYNERNTSSIGSLPDLDISYSKPANYRAYGQSAVWSHDKFFWFAPQYQTLVQIPIAKDRLFLHRVDVQSWLQRTQPRTLLITSFFPSQFEPGDTLSVQLETSPAVDAVDFQVVRGPSSVKCDSNGRLEWKVPVDWNQPEVEITVNARAENRMTGRTFVLQCPSVIGKAKVNSESSPMKRSAKQTPSIRREWDESIVRRISAQAEQRRVASLKRRQEIKNDFRMWTDQEGNGVEAKVETHFASQLVLRLKTGNTLTVDVKSLSQADQDYVRGRKDRQQQLKLRLQSEEELSSSESLGPLQTVRAGLSVFASQNDRVIRSYTANSAGKPLLSWRVHLLKFLGGDELYRKFKFDEPWDSEHNRTLISKMPDFYRIDDTRVAQGKTTLLAVVGPGGVLRPPGNNPRLRTQRDAESVARLLGQESNSGDERRVLVIQAPAEQAVEWTRPVDFNANLETLERSRDPSDRSVLVLMDDGAIEPLKNRLSGEKEDLPSEASK